MLRISENCVKGSMRLDLCCVSMRLTYMQTMKLYPHQLANGLQRLSTNRTHCIIIVFLYVILLFPDALYALNVENQNGRNGVQKNAVSEVILGDESISDTLITRQKTWLIRIPEQSIMVSFYGYSCTLDKSLLPDNTEIKVLNVVERVEIRVGETIYKYEMLHYPIKNFNSEYAISPDKKWLVLPYTSTKGFVIFPLFEDDFSQHAFQLYFSVGCTGLHHEFLGWYNDNTIMLRIGLSESFYLILYNLEDNQYKLENTHPLIDLQLHKNKIIDPLKEIID